MHARHFRLNSAYQTTANFQIQQIPHLNIFKTFFFKLKASTTVYCHLHKQKTWNSQQIHHSIRTHKPPISDYFFGTFSFIQKWKQFFLWCHYRFRKFYKIFFVFLLSCITFHNNKFIPTFGLIQMTFPICAFPLSKPPHTILRFYHDDWNHQFPMITTTTTAPHAHSETIQSSVNSLPPLTLSMAYLSKSELLHSGRACRR